MIHSVTAPGSLDGVTLATQVGQPFDAATLSRDVRALWNSGRFHDVSVETIEQPEGTDVIFHAVPEPRYAIHEIRLTPNPYGIQLSLPPDTLINRARARELAATAEAQLRERGYSQAKVKWKFEPAAHGQYNLILPVTPGENLRLRVTGDTPIGHRPKVYSTAALEDYAARLTSHYIALGYSDAQVTFTQEVHGKDARVNYTVNRGDFHRAIDLKSVCGCLFRDRREAERRGILAFHVTMNDSSVPVIDRGRPYTVGRIQFTGNTHYSDAAVRRNFVLDEGAPLDGLLLRHSLARLGRAGTFENVDMRQVRIQDTARPGVADITISLLERKRGWWNFSGPLPLSAAIGARLPAWGKGILELSTYAVSFNLLAYSSILKLTTARRFLPVIALERPFTPGGGWWSGFGYAPQYSGRISAANYLFTQFDRRIQPKLAGERGPDLTIAFQRPAGEAALVCEAPRPRFAAVRAAAGITLHVARSFAAF